MCLNSANYASYFQPFLRDCVQAAKAENMASREIAATSSCGEVNYLQNELSSLGIVCKRMNGLNDKGELEALTIAIKEVYFQDYKSAYNNSASSIEIDQSHFEHLI